MSATQVPFHTYLLPCEKPVISIFKSLASNLTKLEVKTDLFEKNLKVIEVNQCFKKAEDESVNISTLKKYNMSVFAKSNGSPATAKFWSFNATNVNKWPDT